MKRLALGLVLAIALSGCGTFVDAAGIGGSSGRWDFSGDLRIYGGVRWDIEAIADDPQLFLLVLDLPFSLAFDTLLLPVTVVYTLLDR